MNGRDHRVGLSRCVFGGGELATLGANSACLRGISPADASSQDWYVEVMTDSPAERILLSAPDVGAAEREALVRAFDDGWIAPLGPELNGFEAELAAYVGAEACAGMSTGTAAIQLGLQILGVKPGDEVVVQSATFAASAFAVVHAGAIPVLCDSASDTWCLDPEALNTFLAERAAEDRLPAAVVPVDLYGFVPDYAALQQVCESYGVPIVEDAAEALGSIGQDGVSAGRFGRLGVFSFNGNKIMTTSGGGALVGDAESMERARWLSSQAREDHLWYEHVEVGYNFRMSNLLAALGRAQLAGLEDKIVRRTEINDRYRTEFPELEFTPKGVTERPNNWLSVALLPAGADPMDLCTYLGEQAIEARPFWKPMHQQPVFADHEMIGGKVADELFARGICLPSGSRMTDGQQDRVVAAMRDWLNRSAGA